jgi:serine/threonine protein kinase
MVTGLQQIGKYELHRRLASSHTSECWKAYDGQSQHYVTIKAYHTNQPPDSDSVTQFVRSLEKLASLHHPNIVQLRDVYIFPSRHPDDPVASTVCVVTDYVEGQTLAEYIRNTPNLGKVSLSSEVVQLFTSISIAIDYAHQHGIVHGNIKPGNILLNRVTTSPGGIGDPVLTDFGFTKPLRSASNAGVPFYLSPEQVQGHPPDERSDFYSLGVVLYELCTGVLPFRGNRPIAIMMQHINTPPTPPALLNPTIPSALTSVILRSLSKDPRARFTSASSMAIALAQGLNMPVPEGLSQSAYLPDLSSGSEKYKYDSLQTTGSPVMPELSPSQSAQPQHSRPGIVAAPAGGVSSIPLAPAALPGKRQRKPFNTLYALIGVLLLAILLTTGALFLAPRNTALAPGQVIGHAFFLNSGQLNANGPQGINDELQIDLAHVSDPAAGKSYFAWLLGDRSQSEGAPVLLGRLTVSQGNVHLLYRGDPQHTNLLASVSRFLITEDNANSPTGNPLIDTSTWRYYAEIPQLPSPTDQLHFSMLDHLRHLLVESPELKLRGLHGGLAFWLARNTSTIAQLAASARDAWQNKDTASIRDQVIRILDYIDGSALAHTDAPPGTPLLANAHEVQVALLGPAPRNTDPAGYVYSNDTPPGYVYLIGEHMNGAIQSPQTTPGQRQLAIHINAGLDDLRHLLGQVYQDAKQLVGMTGAQLLQTSSLSILNDMATQAQYAYAGQLNQSTGQAEGGALWIYGNLQRLATFDVRQYIPPAQ